MNNLKHLRERYDLSYRELSAHVGIDFSNLSVMEKRDIRLTLNTINKLRNFYDVTVDYLLGNSDVGFRTLYEYKDKRQVATITESELDHARDEGCLEEIVLPKRIERVITGSVAKEHFDTEEEQEKTKSIGPTDLIEMLRNMSKEEKDEMMTYAKYIVMRKQAKEMVDFIKDNKEKDKENGNNGGGS